MDKATAHLERWKRQMSRIEPEVLRLYQWRKWFRRIREMVDANPRINKWHPLYDWMLECYVTSASTAIRRLMDPGSPQPSGRQRQRFFSLEKLVQNINKHSGDISRSWFVGRYSYDKRYIQAGYADSDYNHFAGVGGDHPLMEDLPELESARRAAEPIARMVDKVIAHLDEKPPSQMPMLNDLDKAIDAIGALFNVLYCFVELSQKLKLEAGEWFDWKWLFQEPWMIPVEAPRLANPVTSSHST